VSLAIDARAGTKLTLSAIASVEEDVDLFITEMQRVGAVMQLAWVSVILPLPAGRACKVDCSLTADGARRWLLPR
jgi:hypothetical protein